MLDGKHYSNDGHWDGLPLNSTPILLTYGDENKHFPVFGKKKKDSTQNKYKFL